MNESPSAHSCSSSTNTSISCESPLLLVTPHNEDNAKALNPGDTSLFMALRNNAMTNWQTLNTRRHMLTNHPKVVKWNKLLLFQNMCVDIGASASTRGSDGLKEDPAGYYGMPGICWGNIGLPVWACRAWSVLIALFHSLPFFSPYLSEKIPQEGEEKEMWGDRTRDECVKLLKRDGMCLCVLLREGQCLVQFSINPALRQSAKGFNRGR